MSIASIILALLVIAFLWRRHLVHLYGIWRAETPVKKEIHRMLYHLDARDDEKTAEKHIHNAIMLKAKEIWEDETSTD